MTSLMPKIKALIGLDWVKESHQDQLKEDGHVEDFKCGFGEGAGAEAVIKETVLMVTTC